MHIALVLHTIHSSSQWISWCFMRTLINCRAFFFSTYLLPYWITKSVPSFVYTTLKGHSLFFCMPYYLLSSALLLLTLLPLFQNQSRKSTCWPWYHFGNICFLHNICRPSLLQDERLCFDDYFKVHNIWILVSTFNSSIPQQNSMQHPFQYIPSSMPLDFLSEVTPALNILTSLIYYGTTFYLGPHWFFPLNIAKW